METEWIGNVLNGRFRVESIIGRGGMAIVYRAYDLRRKQTVALKVLREEYRDDAEYRSRMRREAEVCRKLNHPNVVNMISCENIQGCPAIAMEFVDGQTLKEIIHRDGSIEPEQAVRYATAILMALGHAHARGIIHRDIKSQNILISKNGQVKVADFGIAGMAETETLSEDGSVMGSVHYFSPEQAKGMKATAASDLYSTGIMLYEMLCGRVPFEGENAVSVAMMHLMQEPKPIREYADVSPALAMIVEKALKKKPQERYTSAEQMIRDLRRALRHPDGVFMAHRRRPVIPAHNEKASGRNPRAGFGKKLPIVLMAAAALMLIVMGGMQLYKTLFITVRIPNLNGLDQMTAERLLRSAQLEPSFLYSYGQTAEGFVCGQEPSAETSAAKGSTVWVTISRGSGDAALGRLIGLTQEDAVAKLLQDGMLVGDIRVEPSEMLRGTVIDQQPQAGTRVMPGESVDLVVSGGRVIVPELEGLRIEEAEQRIRATGLTLGEVTQQMVENSRQDGMVLVQSPEKFVQVLPGSVIDLTQGVYDRRRFTADASLTVLVPEGGVNVRVTLVQEDSGESDMYQATLTQPGEQKLTIQLRSETSGVMTWRTYLDGNFAGEATAVLQ